MTNLTAARAARVIAALNKQYRFIGATETFRQRIERGVYGSAEQVNVPKLTYNRRKFNRMNAEEQTEYERKLSETKVEYRLIYKADPDRFTSVSKLIHDWFVELKEKTDA